MNRFARSLSLICLLAGLTLAVPTATAVLPTYQLVADEPEEEESGVLPWELEVECEDGQVECEDSSQCETELTSIQVPHCADPIDPPSEADCDTDVPDEEFQEGGGPEPRGRSSSYVASTVVVRGILCVYARWKRIMVGPRLGYRVTYWARHYLQTGRGSYPFHSGKVKAAIQWQELSGGRWRTIASADELRLVRSSRRPTVGGHRRRTTVVLALNRRVRYRVIFFAPEGKVIWAGQPLDVFYPTMRWVGRTRIF